ncbi:MAG: hypothetical protein K2M64_03220 [Clostridia bacterium]|nr:hypothetical protein [Clostridia bacterium]
MKKFTRVMAVMMVAVIALALLVSCSPNSNPDKALSALKENGYTAARDTLVVPTALAIVGVKGIDVVISGSKIDDGKTEHVTIIYFNNSSSANDAWDAVKKYAEDNKDNKDSNWVFAKSGAMIYYGTSAGVKAAK